MYERKMLSAANSVAEEQDYLDTFLDPEHIIASFPSAKTIDFVDHAGKCTSVVAEGAAVPGSMNSILVGQAAGMQYRLRIAIESVATTATAMESVQPSTQVVVTSGSKQGKGKKGKVTAIAQSSATESASSAKSTSSAGCTAIEKLVIVATAYGAENKGPYPEDRSPRNRIRFTPTQVEAIRSGMHKVLVQCIKEHM
jgi:hypothetical protein